MRHEFVYKEIGEKKLEMSFFEPLKKKYEKAPVLVMIPGGGWVAEVRESMIEFFAVAVEILRNEGFAVASIDYRVMEDKVKMVDIIADCCDAVRYLARNAQELGIDAERIVTTGHSAGGQLALMVAYSPFDKFRDETSVIEKYTVKATAPLSPVAVIYDHSYHILDNLSVLYDDLKDENEVGETEPVSCISEKCPPTIVLTGTMDNIIFPKTSEVLYEKLNNAGAKAKLLYSYGGGHSYEQMDENIAVTPSYEILQEEIVEFILEEIK